MIFYFAVIGVLICFPDTIETLDCFNCKDTADPQTCNLIVSCASGQSCFLQTRQSWPTTTYDMGCQSNQLCGNTGSIVGRSVYKRQQVACHECCSSNGCNDQLCAHRKPTICIDDDSFDCAQLNSLLNICSDVHHAKTICPKFCGLCSLVDGNWDAWNSWSSCDVTCDNGTQIRTRTCTNPVPQDGGLDCQGANNQTKVCVNQLCPVHGGWTRWSGWSSCSVSCDTGLSKRTRSCTNPKPYRFGDNCFGDAQDYRVCMQQPCSSGNWTSWNTWSECSVTCGLGQRYRNRSCEYSSQSVNSFPCEGNDFQSQPCRNTTCEKVMFNFYGYSMTSYRIRFTHQVQNIGNAYDSSTGYFIAPSNGSYFFSYQICSYSNVYDFYLYKADTNLSSRVTIGIAKIYSYNSYDCSSTSVATKLQKGDRVWVQCSSSGPSAVDSTSYRTWFSGSLITVE